MRILLTNFSLCQPGGSETFLHSLACQLQRLNHHIEIYSPNLGGIMLNRFQEAGIHCFNSLTGQEQFDVIHVQHHDPALEVISRLSHIPMVYTSLGVIPIQEHPPQPVIATARQFIAVSEEVKTMLVNHHGIPKHKIKIIRNGINLNRFKPSGPLKRNPKMINILIHNNYPDQLSGYLELIRLCRNLPFHFTLLGHENPNLQARLDRRRVPCRLVPSTWNVEKIINSHDLVIGLGRSALEGMACGKPVIVYRPGQADGIITRRNVDFIKQCNFSGRYYRYPWSPRDVLRAIRWIFTKNRHIIIGRLNRTITLQQFNIANTAREFCAIYEWASQER